MALLQLVLSRLQKERDSAQEELDKLHERMELQQGQVSKAQRDRDGLLAEIDILKERLEKSEVARQRLQVPTLHRYHFRFGPIIFSTIARTHFKRQRLQPVSVSKPKLENCVKRAVPAGFPTAISMGIKKERWRQAAASAINTPTLCPGKREWPRACTTRTPRDRTRIDRYRHRILLFSRSRAYRPDIVRERRSRCVTLTRTSDLHAPF